MLIRPLLAGVLALVFVQVHAADSVAPAAPAATPAASKPVAPAIEPTLADVPYGTHPKQVLDFYKAESAKPTALVFYIHGGGWTAGSKARPPHGNFLKNGISVVSVEYRFIQEAMAGGAKPPVEWPLHDAARALQFVRSKAQEWNIDKKRIGATGGSAGACSSLWLAFHDDFLAHREELLPWIKEYSPYELVTSDDPPVYLFYRDVPAIGQPAKDPTHTSNYGVKLQEKAKSVGIECELVYPGAPDVKHASIEAYLLEKLK